MVDGVPKLPFWRNLGVQFESVETLLSGSHRQINKVSHPVVALDCSPGKYPAPPKLDALAVPLRWSANIEALAEDFIAKHLPRPFVAVPPDHSPSLFFLSRCFPLSCLGASCFGPFLLLLRSNRIPLAFQELIGILLGDQVHLRQAFFNHCDRAKGLVHSSGQCDAWVEPGSTPQPDDGRAYDKQTCHPDTTTLVSDVAAGPISLILPLRASSLSPDQARRQLGPPSAARSRRRCQGHLGLRGVRCRSRSAAADRAHSPNTCSH